MPARTPPTVLVVDDDPHVLRLLGRVLEAADLACVLTATADEALDAMRWALPNMLLIDYLLPKRTGADLYREITEMLHGHPPAAVLVTGNLEATPRADIEIFADCIAKPFLPTDLIGRVQAVLATAPALRPTGVSLLPGAPAWFADDAASRDDPRA